MSSETCGNIFIHAVLLEVRSGRRLLTRVLYLSHFFDFRASFADEGATLAGWDDEPQSYWGFTGGWTVAHGVDYILKGGKTEFVRNRRQSQCM